MKSLAGCKDWGTPARTRVPPTWDWGTTCLRLGYPHLGLGTVPRKGPGTSHWVPLERVWDQWRYYGMEMGYPPRKDMGPVEVLWDGDAPPPGVNRQTPVKTVPSPSFGCGR